MELKKNTSVHENETVSIDISRDTGVKRTRTDLHLRLPSNNLSNSQRATIPSNLSRSKATKNHGITEDQTIEQMSPINVAADDTDVDRLSSTQRNFFREDPEKGFSKQLRNMTA